MNISVCIILYTIYSISLQLRYIYALFYFHIYRDASSLAAVYNPYGMSTILLLLCLALRLYIKINRYPRHLTPVGGLFYGQEEVYPPCTPVGGILRMAHAVWLGLSAG